MDQGACNHEGVGTPALGGVGARAGAEVPADAHSVFHTFGAPPEGPYEVGHLAVSPAGRVAAYPSPCPVAFDFVYRGVPFHADLPGDPESELSLTAVLGVLPYTAETQTGRRATLEILRLARPARGRFALARGERIQVHFSAPVPRPRTPVTVVATVSCLLVDLRPYLDLLAAAGALRPR